MDSLKKVWLKKALIRPLELSESFELLDESELLESGDEQYVKLVIIKQKKEFLKIVS